MSIEYTFKLEHNLELHYEIDIDRAEDSERDLTFEPEWTELKHSRCTNCPLDETKHSHCPVALDLRQVVDDFKDLPSMKKASVTVVSEEREYMKMVGLEEGLRALMGLIMASSNCPVLEKLKPMARHHLPFSTMDEFILRSVSIYLTQQYFIHRDGGEPDWDLKGLVANNKELQLVNQAFWQRIHSACGEDSNLKALLSFFTLSSSVSYSLETQLQKLRREFM
ncbi:hypothetical protein MIB92_03710 [Aestuariirhabdus sp. Z084]|uniref:DUF6901 family protein n=1 Tax=Aestuariirhabdus haliotis TaxID=2918751 RepID=UPI00201B423B|nr:hypothetical protein [Aestuariirhabdus haliotis]MCL6414746.1 hypothetical protein [Aestuariirhabdus haliotis]MCL6418678.1 hypothetical protein [Aestuariirhabdus haliotis]